MTSEPQWGSRRFHFVGIGGSGMSGLACACAALGAEVSGSDRVEGAALERLRARGVSAVVGHAPGNVPHAAELVYSSAVKPDNVERARGRELGLKEIRRGELLGEVARLRRCIAIAGTHGKTTTAAMTVHALRGAGITSGYVIGAELRDGCPSSQWESDGWLVVETDESDRSFLAVKPEIAVVTNIAFEHMNNYASLDEIREAFAAFAAGAGRVLAADWHELVRDVRLGPDGVRFQWRGRSVRLRVPGEHNAHNAAAALEACHLVGADPELAVSALARFPGVKRRLEPVGFTPSGARIYEDCAIHPNEVRASLAALRTVEQGRVVVVFEPLLYSRTRVLAHELGEALAAADALVVLELFPGSEVGERHPGVSGRLVADAAAARSDGEVAWIPDGQAAREHLEGTLHAGDACVMMGISGPAQRLAGELLR